MTIGTSVWVYKHLKEKEPIQLEKSLHWFDLFVHKIVARMSKVTFWKWQCRWKLIATFGSHCFSYLFIFALGFMRCALCMTKHTMWLLMLIEQLFPTASLFNLDKIHISQASMEQIFEPRAKRKINAIGWVCMDFICFFIATVGFVWGCI